MLTRTILFTLPGLLAVAGVAAAADEVRYFEKDGITYQETRRVIRRPIVETRLEPREQTVYREKLTTDYHPTERRYMQPVTEYAWQPEWVNTWNPFSAPYVTYRWMPTTRWVEKTESVKMAVTKREVVPEKVTTNVPVTTQRFAEDEYVTRVAVSAKPQSAAPTSLSPPSATPGPGGDEGTLANRQPIGGVRRLENDPKRDGDWRPATDDRYRR